MSTEVSMFMKYLYDCRFTNAPFVVRELNKIVRNYWLGRHINYISVPHEVRDLWWNKFKVNFTYFIFS